MSGHVNTCHRFGFPLSFTPQATGVPAKDALDAIITNVLIVDYWGIVKADVGIKGNKIVGIGKGGNPDVMDGVAENMVVGVSCSCSVDRAAAAAAA